MESNDWELNLGRKKDDQEVENELTNRGQSPVVSLRGSDRSVKMRLRLLGLRFRGTRSSQKLKNI